MSSRKMALRVSAEYFCGFVIVGIGAGLGLSALFDIDFASACIGALANGVVCGVFAAGVSLIKHRRHLRR